MSYTRDWDQDKKVEFIKDVLDFLLGAGTDSGIEGITQVLLEQARDTFDELMEECKTKQQEVRDNERRTIYDC